MVNKAKSETINIFIVDDHPIVRDGLKLLIKQQDDMNFIGEAQSISEAFSLLRNQPPDVVLVDISLKDGNGLDLIKQLQTHNSSIKILVSSMHDENLYADRVIRAGALGYICKQVPSENIIEAIRTVSQGQLYLSPQMTQRIIQQNMGKNPKGLDPLECLSDRELAVFEFSGEGKSTKEIANYLHISAKTVETYKQHIKEKLGLENAVQLMQHAVKWILENPNRT